ncbi:MAG: ankyrin repeat domain-containing protein [Gammaproteobacteria bacterium]
MRERPTLQELAFDKLSKNAQLKIRLDEATKPEDKLYYAIKYQHLGIIEHLFSTNECLSPNTVIWHGYPAFHIAAKEGSVNVMNLFLGYGISVKNTDKDGNTILHCLIEQLKYFDNENHLILLKYFLHILTERGLDQKNNKEQTPLEILDQNPITNWNQTKREEIKGKIAAAIEEVKSDKYHIDNSLPDITPVAPEQLALTEEDEIFITLYQEGSYGLILGQDSEESELLTESEPLAAIKYMPFTVEPKPNTIRSIDSRNIEAAKMIVVGYALLAMASFFAPVQQAGNNKNYELNNQDNDQEKKSCDGPG